MQGREQPPPYAPPGQGPMYAPPTAQPTVITTAPTVMVPTMIVSQSTYLGSNPTFMVCPSCNAQIVTRVESNPSVRTHIIAALLCLFTFWPCVCLPYCIGSCNNADHYCPNCNSYLGNYKF